MVNDRIIDLLEHLLKKANEGEIHSIIYVTACENKTVSHGWLWDIKCHRKRILAELLTVSQSWLKYIDLTPVQWLIETDTTQEYSTWDDEAPKEAPDDAT